MAKPQDAILNRIEADKLTADQVNKYYDLIKELAQKSKDLRHGVPGGPPKANPNSLSTEEKTEFSVLVRDRLVAMNDGFNPDFDGAMRVEDALSIAVPIVGIIERIEEMKEQS